MAVERNIESTLVETKPVNRTTFPIEVSFPERAATLTSTLVDAKEFSLDIAEGVVTEGRNPVTCGGGKCIRPCVQQCLPGPAKPPGPKPPPAKCK